jgi:hypothetical protein
MSKLPAIQFYPGDWLRDPIAGCSLEAQGLWLRMMFLAHDSERYGYLQTNGSPTPPGSIARRCGCTLAQYEALFLELSEAGVPSITPSGVIFSRRMVRDAEVRAQTAERVRKARENKEDTGKRSNGGVTPMYEAEDEDGFCSFWKVYPKRIGKISARRAWRKISGAKEHLLEILEGVEKWKLSQQWQDAQYIPYPATFLNDRRWEAEVPTNARQPSKTEQRSHANAAVVSRVLDAVDRGAGRTLQAGIERTATRALPQGTPGFKQHGD